MNRKLKDPLGNRIKKNYEDRTRFHIPRRTYTIIRIDGKAFHSWTKNLGWNDRHLSRTFCETSEKCLQEFQGAKFAYVQSDEVSFLLTDFETPTTEAWFDGNVQKIASVSASIFTAYFNLLDTSNPFNPKPACFDSRVFCVPDFVEVENYFIWRQRDCYRNFINSLAQEFFSAEDLMCESTRSVMEMIRAHPEAFRLYQEHKHSQYGKLVEKDNTLNAQNWCEFRDEISCRIPTIWKTTNESVGV